MAHVIEPASSGRATCRGCGKRIPKGALRLGERLPNPFAEGEMTLWFHVPCGAYLRPGTFLEALASAAEHDERYASLYPHAEAGLAHRRLPRARGAERAPTGRARCRSCRERIDRDTWRIPLVFYEDGRFNPSGFIHARCAGAYLETTDLLDRVRHFSADLTEQELEAVEQALQTSPGPEGS